MESNGKFRNERGRIQNSRIGTIDIRLTFAVLGTCHRLTSAHSKCFAFCNTENTVAQHIAFCPICPCQPLLLAKSKSSGRRLCSCCWSLAILLCSWTRGICDAWHFVALRGINVVPSLSMSSHVLATSLLESSTLHHATMPHRNTPHTLQDIVAVSTVITASEKCSQWKQELGIAASFVFRSSFLVFYINDQ